MKPKLKKRFCPETSRRRAEAPLFDANHRMRCVHCGGYSLPLPVEPLYKLDVVAELIPCSRASLLSLLKRNRARFPARYINEGRMRRRLRVLTGAEVRLARQLRFPELDAILGGTR